jgi:hypothetical protein
MPPDHDHFNDRVNLDDAGPVMCEIDSPIPLVLWLTAAAGTGLNFAAAPHRPAEPARGAT